MGKVDVAGEQKAGLYVATDDAAQITEWSIKYPKCNWAVRTGRVSNVTVIDIDMKENCNGLENFLKETYNYDKPEKFGDKDFLKFLEKNGALTRIVKTPGGGYHLYYKYAEDVKQTTSIIDGVDIRNDGGYVVCEPSSDPRGTYTLISETDIIFMPNCMRKGSVAHKDAIPLGDRIYMKYASSASKGSRNHTLFDMICQLRDNNFSASEAESYACRFADEMGEDFPRREAEVTARSAYAKAAREGWTGGEVSYSATQSSATPAQAKKAEEDILTKTESDHHGHFKVFDAIYGANVGFSPELGMATYVDGYWDLTTSERHVTEMVIDTLRMRKKAAQVALSTCKDEDKEKILKALIKECKCSRANIEAVKGLIKDLKLIRHTDFNKNNHLMNVKNGVIDLKTKELMPHDRKYMFSYKLDVTFDKRYVDAKTPEERYGEWYNFVFQAVNKAEEFNPDDTENYDTLQQMTGYFMTGETSEECLAYINGPSRSGKGTFMNTISKLMGPLAGNIDINTLMNRRRGDNQNFELASISHARFVTASETDKNTWFDSGKIKTLTGGDPVSCSHKFKTPFSFIPKFKLCISSNHDINIDANDSAAWNRFRVFTFPNSHIDNPDTTLKERLNGTLSQVLMWCVDGAYDWYKNKEAGKRLPITKSMQEYVTSRVSELDTIGEFLEAWKIDPEHEKAKADEQPKAHIYKLYVEHCKNAGIDMKLGPNNFNSEMKTRGFELVRPTVNGKREWCYLVHAGTMHSC